MLRASLFLIAAAFTAMNVSGAPPLVVHEWGTFTSFQDDEGATISGINVDDEPVPDFVHRLRDMPIFTTRSVPALWSQGAPRCHSDVTLRLETPVVYFYPQHAFPPEQSLDVRATFVGGWLTEFFPAATADKIDFPEGLDRTTRGSLQWRGLQFATAENTALPQTEERVWLAPREVRSAVVRTEDAQEAEKYLFYRGVGHIDAPVVVRQQNQSVAISLRDGERLLKRLPKIWIVQVLLDGRIAYRTVRTGEQIAVSAPLPAANGASRSSLDALRDELAETLVAEGLFEDEAQAMLETWQLSYFESEGLRVFFVLPRSWTDAHLPLEISTAADLTRVMLGRVELISAHQRAALHQLYELPIEAFDVQPLYLEDQSILKAMHNGTASHAESYRKLGREVPKALQLYESLGRFRDALLAHELRSIADEATRMKLNRAIARFSSCVPGSPTE